jgi:hypothetical protein
MGWVFERPEDEPDFSRQVHLENCMISGKKRKTKTKRFADCPCTVKLIWFGEEAKKVIPGTVEKYGE